MKPDDEHTADCDARLRRVLERRDEAVASVTVEDVLAYLATPCHGWTRDSPDHRKGWVHRSNQRVWLEAGSGPRIVGRIARIEGRHLALVLTDILPRRWGLDESSTG